MNKKKILTCLAALTLSFNVFAVDVQEASKRTTQDSTELNQEHSPNTPLSTRIVNSQTIAQASAEEPAEFMTAFSVYLLIIIVYSVYGFTANAKDIGN